MGEPLAALGILERVRVSALNDISSSHPSYAHLAIGEALIRAWLISKVYKDALAPPGDRARGSRGGADEKYVFFDARPPPVPKGVTHT